MLQEGHHQKILVASQSTKNLLLRSAKISSLPAGVSFRGGGLWKGLRVVIQKTIGSWFSLGQI